MESPSPADPRTVRARMSDADVSRCYRAILDAEADAHRALLGWERADAGERDRKLQRQVRQTYARAMGLTAGQMRAIVERGPKLLERAAAALAAVGAAPVPAGAADAGGVEDGIAADPANTAIGWQPGEREAWDDNRRGLAELSAKLDALELRLAEREARALPDFVARAAAVLGALPTLWRALKGE